MTALATPATIAALPPAVTAGVGARLPFTEYEAENAAFAGVAVGLDRRFGTVAAEASGRRAVRLVHPGDHVEWTLAAPADALTLRASVPDSADGRGQDAALALTIDGHPAGTIALTSRFGWFYGRYPFTNRPADGLGHHAFDETRHRLPRLLPAGTRVRVSLPAAARVPVTVDLADFEVVPPPRPAPADAISVVARGADPTGRQPARAAFERAVAAGVRTGRPVWVPPGRYRIDGHLVVDNVTIAGAGPWYSVLTGDRVGVYGRPAPAGSAHVTLRDFAIEGQVTERVDRDQVNGVGGALSDSLLQNLFIHHTKVGVWLDGPMHDLRIAHLRITDTTADGINLHRGVTRAEITDTFVRNTGDDGLAAWSGGGADRAVTIRGNTVVAPILANGIAIYGGADVTVADNLVADTLTEGGGLHLGNRFASVPLAGTIRLDGNVVVRGGSRDPHWGYGVGALWFYALDHPIAADIRITRTRLIDSSLDAVLFTGLPIGRVTLDGLSVERAGGPALTIRSRGSARLANSRANGLAGPAIRRCTVGFALDTRTHNTGFSSTSSGCTPDCGGRAARCGEDHE